MFAPLTFLHCLSRLITIGCEILNESAVFFATVAQFQFFINTRTLPLSDWVPYDISSNIAFWATMVHQTIGLMVCANASVAHETLISGFMIQTCAQLDILCHRARTLPDLLREAQKSSTSKDDFKAREQRLIREFVHHHRFIYRWKAKLIRAWRKEKYTYLYTERNNRNGADLRSASMRFSPWWFSYNLP